MPDLYAMQRAAGEAKALSENPAFRRAFDKLYKGAIDAIQHSQPEQTQEREEAYWRLRTLKDLDHSLAAEITAAKIEAQRQGDRS